VARAVGSEYGIKKHSKNVSTTRFY